MYLHIPQHSPEQKRRSSVYLAAEILTMAFCIGLNAVCQYKPPIQSLSIRTNETYNV